MGRFTLINGVSAAMHIETLDPLFAGNTPGGSFLNSRLSGTPELSAREPVTVDMGLPRSQRESSFNESLVKAAKALGGATFSRATGTPPANNDVPKDNLPKASGTGFFVNDGGMALTNAHVIRDCSAIRAVFRDGKSVSATVMGVDRENDLALLRTETRSKAFGQFRISSPVRQGRANCHLWLPSCWSTSFHR